MSERSWEQGRTTHCDLMAEASPRNWWSSLHDFMGRNQQSLMFFIVFIDSIHLISIRFSVHHQFRPFWCTISCGNPAGPLTWYGNVNGYCEKQRRIRTHFDCREAFDKSRQSFLLLRHKYTTILCVAFYIISRIFSSYSFFFIFFDVHVHIYRFKHFIRLLLYFISVSNLTILLLCFCARAHSHSSNRCLLIFPSLFFWKSFDITCSSKNNE